MARSTWKVVERRIAALLGGERVPISGRQRGYAPDIDHEWMALEVKSRKTPLKLLVEMMAQAEASAAYSKKKTGVEKMPVGIYHVDNTPYGNSYVILRLDDFIDRFGT